MSLLLKLPLNQKPQDPQVVSAGHRGHPGMPTTLVVVLDVGHC